MGNLCACGEVIGLPMEFITTFKPSNMWGSGYPCWTFKGDTNSFLTLAFDNLATQLSLVGIISGLGYTSEFAYEYMMPGVGISLLFGNLYYALQASKVAMKTGNMDTCAQPYGINTPGAIAKCFAVLGAGYAAAQADGYTGLEAMEKGWSIACVANFVGGMVEFLGAFVAPFMINTIPEGALLVPVAGVGITWLGFGPIMHIWSGNTSDWPLPAMIPFIMIFIAFFGTDKLFGPLPVMLVACVSGIALYIVFNPAMTADALENFEIMDPLESGWDRYIDNLEAALDNIEFHAPKMPDYAYGMDYIKDHFGVVFGLATTNFIGTFSCVAAAREGGDTYSPMESMMIDGMGSMLGAAFGSPWGTTIYIGHKTYKKFGATRGYSTLNGLLYCAMGFLGLHAVLDAALPHEILYGVLVCVGFMVVQQCVESVPVRWYPATFIGIAVCFCDWMMTFGTSYTGVATFDQGYIVNSLMLTFLLMMLTDRWYMHAVVVLILMAALTFVGIMHSDQVMIDLKTENLGIKIAPDTSIGIDLADPAGGGPSGDGSMGMWKLVFSYVISAGLCLVFWLLQRVYLSPAAEKEDFRVLQKIKYGKPSEVAEKEEPEDPAV